MKKNAEGRSNLPIIVLLAAFTVTMAMLTACTNGSTEPTKVESTEVTAPMEMPAIDAAALLETRCSICHSADKPRQSQKTHEGWDSTVSRMIKKGAKLTDAEKTALVDYLAENYGQ